MKFSSYATWISFSRHGVNTGVSFQLTMKPSMPADLAIWTCLREVIPAVIARLAPRYPAVVFNATIVQPGIDLYGLLRGRNVELQIGRVDRRLG